jgi:hypothetical protein
MVRCRDQNFAKLFDGLKSGTAAAVKLRVNKTRKPEGVENVKQYLIISAMAFFALILIVENASAFF